MGVSLQVTAKDQLGAGRLNRPRGKLMPAFGAARRARSTLRQVRAGMLRDGMSSFTASEIEAGRKLFTADWQFSAAAGTVERLPPMKGVEIAFAGRSNVGKSSLI